MALSLNKKIHFANNVLVEFFLNQNCEHCSYLLLEKRVPYSTTSGAPIKDECTEFLLKLTQRFFRIFFKDVIVYYYYFAIYSFPPRDGCTGLQAYVKLTHFQLILQIHTNLKISIHLSYEENMPLRFETK